MDPVAPPEVFGTCLNCESHSLFPEVVRRLDGGRCSTCGSESILNPHTVPPIPGVPLDTRFLRGARFRRAA